MPQTEKQRVGRIGEDIASMFLMKHGYNVIDRNYRKAFGEIDIVAQKDGKIYFIEVKSILERNQSPSLPSGGDVSHETMKGNYRPEDNVNPEKQRRLSRAIQVYLEEKNVSHETDWYFDIITVRIDESKRMGRVVHIKDIILQQ